MEMNIGHDRHFFEAFTMAPKAGRRGLVRAGNPHDIDARFLGQPDLLDVASASAVSVLVMVWTVNRRIRRRPARIDHDPPRFAAHDVAIGPDAHGRQCSLAGRLIQPPWTVMTQL